MQKGSFSRQLTISTRKQSALLFRAFLSLEKKEAAYIHLTIEMLEGTGTITLDF